MKRLLLAFGGAVGAVVLACSGAAEPTAIGDVNGHPPPVDLGAPTVGSDGGFLPAPAPVPAAEAGARDLDGDAGEPPPAFATKVVSFTAGKCAGFGQEQLPAIVLGPPQGGGDAKGSLDVVSLGNGGEIILSFEPSAIVDGPGTDLLVFENAFYPAGETSKPYAEPGEVSVSDDMITWTTFPCTASTPPYGTCAGWHPVAKPGETFDPATAGGDPFDLATIGVTRARYVRIKDRTSQVCNSAQHGTTNGFDLDAIAAVHAEAP